DDLSLISTYHDTAVRHFYGFDMTSAATAQAAWFAAQIMNAYPDIWPETVRALMVHSAEWTDELKRQFLKAETKPAHASLLRVCGYGVPNLQRALQSASDYLTLIAQAEMQPYERRVGGGGYKSKDMHLYELPWPTEALLGMPSKTNVRMRVTLSYFIEPGPGEIGWRDRYRYASHVLRFGVRSPGETTEEFRKRINKAARDEDEDTPGTSSASDYWKIGSQTRRRGSLHSDIWEGSAADLARSGVVAVYPAVGWWRTRAHLGRWNKECRYSLIVSISSPEVGVDIYTPVANQVSITVPTNIPRGARRQQDT
ncbi:MAG: S8 family serine peptidase, partial [Planctomycetota bacterium]